MNFMRRAILVVYLSTMIFVTGGTGLLGSHLLYRLAVEGKQIRAIYRDFSKTERVEKLFRFYDPVNAEKLISKIEWVACDVLDVVTLEEVMSGCDIVYHCAAVVSFNKKDFFRMMKINRQGTANIVNIALDLHYKKLCFVSSTSAVATNEEWPEAALIETNKWTQSPETSGYAISKYSSEKEVWRGVEEGLDAIIINPSMIIGPGNWDESSLTIFRTAANGFKFYTSGANAFVDVRDVTRAMTTLMDSEIRNERFLCTGTNIPFRKLFEMIAKAVGSNPPTIYAGPFLSNVARRLSWLKSIFTGKRTLTRETVRSAHTVTTYDSSKLMQVLDFEFTPLEETIENAVKGRILD